MIAQASSPRRGVLSVVERGWRGARTCSIVLSAAGVPVTHVIKGYVNRDLRAMIQPYRRMHLISVPRPVFRLGLWCALIVGTVTRRLRWVLVDHERTLREIGWWCRLFDVTPVTIYDTEGGYELYQDGRQRLPGELFGIG